MWRLLFLFSQFAVRFLDDRCGHPSIAQRTCGQSAGGRLRCFGGADFALSASFKAGSLGQARGDDPAYFSGRGSHFETGIAGLLVKFDDDHPLSANDCDLHDTEGNFFSYVDSTDPVGTEGQWQWPSAIVTFLSVLVPRILVSGRTRDTYWLYPFFIAPSDSSRCV